MMPRMMLLALALVACRFDADYDDGTFRCSDGDCPAGLVCNAAELCVAPGAPDARALDAAPPDAEVAALTCADPGLIPRGVEADFAGTTNGGVNHVSGTCLASIYNGPDDVYRATAVAGDDLTVTITGESTVRAYVVADDGCVPNPATPPCTGAMVAQPGFALELANLPAGDLFVLVDEVNPVGGTDYTLTVLLAP